MKRRAPGLAIIVAGLIGFAAGSRYPQDVETPVVYEADGEPKDDGASELSYEDGLQNASMWQDISVDKIVGEVKDVDEPFRESFQPGSKVWAKISQYNSATMILRKTAFWYKIVKKQYHDTPGLLRMEMLEKDMRGTLRHLVEEKVSGLSEKQIKNAGSIELQIYHKRLKAYQRAVILGKEALEPHEGLVY